MPAPRVILLLALLLPLAAAETPADGLTIHLSDLPRLRAHWRASPFARIVDELVRGEFADALLTVQRSGFAGAEAQRVLTAAQALDLRFDPTAPPPWLAAARLALTDHHAAALELAADLLDATPAPQAPGLLWRDGHIERKAQTLCFTREGAAVPHPPPAAQLHDVYLRGALRTVPGQPPRPLSASYNLGPAGGALRILLPDPQAPQGSGIDPTLLERLGDDVIACTAAVCDGERLATLLPRLEARRELRALRVALDLRLTGAGLPPLSETIAAVHGTALVALLPRSGSLALLVAVPRAPELDAALTELTGLEQPLPQASRNFALPGLPHQLVIGRDRSHWLIGSESGVLHAFAAATPDAPPRLLASLAIHARPLACGAIDNGRLLAALAPGRGGMLDPLLPPDWHAAIARQTEALEPLLPATTCSLERRPPGLLLSVHNAAIPLALGAGFALAVRMHPAALARSRARMMLGRIGRLVTIFHIERGLAPSDLAVLARAHPTQLDAAALRHPCGDGVSPAYRYIPPAGERPPHDQPLLVDNPACWNGAGSHVVYGGGRVEWHPGHAYWRSATELAARERRVSAASWRRQLTTTEP
ncbi:MAG: hypothetical protein ACOCZK_00255 [Planctomycetota bacterium]